MNVWLKITATQVKVMDMQHHPVVTHQRLYGEQKQSSMNWLPYLRSISRKPRSLFHSGIFDMMPENMQQYMRTCSSADRGSILKVLAELTDRTGFNSALHTIYMSDWSVAVRIHNRWLPESTGCTGLQGTPMRPALHICNY